MYNMYMYVHICARVILPELMKDHDLKAKRYFRNYQH